MYGTIGRSFTSFPFCSLLLPLIQPAWLTHKHAPQLDPKNKGKGEGDGGPFGLGTAGLAVLLSVLGCCLLCLLARCCCSREPLSFSYCVDAMVVCVSASLCPVSKYSRVEQVRTCKRLEIEGYSHPPLLKVLHTWLCFGLGPMICM